MTEVNDPSSWYGELALSGEGSMSQSPAYKSARAGDDSRFGHQNRLENLVKTVGAGLAVLRGTRSMVS